jgi:hypothetical protein
VTLDSQGDNPMTRHLSAAAAIAALAVSFATTDAAAQAPVGAGTQAYGYQWGQSYNNQDWNRLYHYPYVWYPQNFYADGYMQSANDLYHRYPQEMRVPVYNRSWKNDYPTSRLYHHGHHFNLDVF